MTSRKVKLEKSIASLRDELTEIIDKEKEIENKKFIGKFFASENNFSCPEKPSDYWWIYLKVLEIKDGALYVFEFQTDKDGRIEIIPSRYYMAQSLARYEEIKESEYISAWNKVIDNINTF